MNKLQTKKQGLNAAQLQMIAIICMVIDHVGWNFFPGETPTSTALHFIGRITFPIMGFFIAEGYKKSKNVPRYIGRLFLLALISAVPFFLMAQSYVGILQNTVFTLAFGLCALHFAGKFQNKFAKGLIVALFTIVSIIADGGFAGVIMIYCFGTIKNRNTAVIVGIVMLNVVENLLGFSLMTLAGVTFTIGMADIVYIIGTFLAAPLLMSYNGEKGKKSKWGFYIFYPAHLLVIWALSTFI